MELNYSMILKYRITRFKNLNNLIYDQVLNCARYIWKTFGGETISRPDGPMKSW
ncbi:MAG: hypothetical protein O2951_08135 [Bacteroidetes bacterium]|nr:hypothetical protein [Bacteroidota bacterium]